MTQQQQRALQLDDRVQVLNAWPRGAKGKIRVIIGGTKPLVRVDFDHSHRVSGYNYTHQWYHPTLVQIIDQRIDAQEEGKKA